MKHTYTPRVAAMSRSVKRAICTAFIGGAALSLGGCHSAAPNMSPIADSTSRSADTARQARVNPTAGPRVYTGGRWLLTDDTGEEAVFVKQTRCSENGVFVDACGDAKGEIIDLSGKYIIPGLAEGHNHWVEGPWSAESAAALLRSGVFYYKNPSSPLTSTLRHRHLFDGPGSLDVAFSLAALSAPGSHPAPLYRRLASMYGIDPERLDGEAYYAINDVAELEARWPEILAAQPDFIKLIFLDIDREADSSPATLSRATAKRAIDLAHKAGLRVTVHVVTARDYEVAAELGADEAAHLPGFGFAYDLDEDYFRITDAAAALAANNEMAVVTTANIGAGTGQDWREPGHPMTEVQALQSENLATLHRAGVKISIGTDTDYKPIDEMDYLRWLDFASDAELLWMWIRTGPDHIFPGRAIGRFAPGYEASFIALPCNPFENFDCVRDPVHVEKQGGQIK